MQLMTELTFAGGRLMKGAWGELVSANITPDASGITHYDEELFLKVMHTGNPGGRQLNPIMLWGYYRNMRDEDLKAIFAYLQTVEGNLCLPADSEASKAPGGQHRDPYLL
jgi:hypothetical protein